MVGRASKALSVVLGERNMLTGWSVSSWKPGFGIKLGEQDLPCLST